jgi:hypothetical protein
MGGSFITIVCNPGATAQEVFQAAGLDLQLGDQIILNGVAVRPNAQVQPDALILLGKPIEGG